MALNENKMVRLVKRPDGAPDSSCFEVISGSVPEPGEGEFLLENLIFSMDAGVRGFMDEAATFEGYMPQIPLGETVFGMTLGKVLKSNNPSVKVGDYMRGMAKWENYSILNDAIGLEKVEPKQGVPLQHYMGALGPVGLTAWVGMCKIGGVKKGDTVVVNAAAGATGGLAGQIAKLRGARVIGLTSTKAKIERLYELGYDEAINYKTVNDLGSAIAEKCPDGVNVFFDNVGGEMLESILPVMAENGCVVCCGMIADYNNSDAPYGVKSLWNIVLKRLKLQGFLLFDHFDVIPKAQSELNDWAASGELKIFDNIYDGVAEIPTAFIDLMTGKTMGKTLVKA
ncbi:zinc-binding dehydrogenase [Litorimonas haliclonae]|uniref:zinc-binding dehydrogenase n=1 Tax=Litorimonas haliclonae TaxID=2081977 RepID=UPI0039EE9EDD